MDKLGIQVTKAHVKEIGDEENGFVIGVASTSDVDRDGDIIEASGWDVVDFQRNPVWLYSHDTKLLPIGSIPKTWVDGNSLMFRGEFGAHTFGQDVRALHQAGILKTFSVRFDPVEWQYLEDSKSDWPGVHYKRQKLIEVSTVPIPANIEAELQSVKELRYNSIEQDALRRLKQTKAIQSVFGDAVGRAVVVFLEKGGH